MCTHDIIPKVSSVDSLLLMWPTILTITNIVVLLLLLLILFHIWAPNAKAKNQTVLMKKKTLALPHQ